MILCYSVITSGKFTNRDSLEELIGGAASAEEADMMSLEKRVTENTPTAFIWHTFDDNVVPVENSLLFAGALREKEIPFDLHIFNSGPHGLALCDAETASSPEQIKPHAAKWFHYVD